MTVDLNGVIGNDGGKLKFGGRDFAKSSKNILIVEKQGANWLTADCSTKQGITQKSELKLDGSLQITIPAGNVPGKVRVRLSFYFFFTPPLHFSSLNQSFI